MYHPLFQTLRMCSSTYDVNWNFTDRKISLFRLALKDFWDHAVYSASLGNVNNGIGKWRYFCKLRSTLWKLTKIGTDDRCNKVKKVYKISKQCEHFRRDITLSKFYIMSNNWWRYNSVKIDDIISKLCKLTFLHRAYLLVKVHDDRRSRTCHLKQA